MPHKAVGVYSVLNSAGVSIVCLTGQRCLFGPSWDTGYLINASEISGCLFCAQLGRGVYSVPPGAQNRPIRFAKSSGGLLVV